MHFSRPRCSVPVPNVDGMYATGKLAPPEHARATGVAPAHDTPPNRTRLQGAPVRDRAHVAVAAGKARPCLHAPRPGGACGWRAHVACVRASQAAP
eukprot:3938133-Rhodomonas_salina.2